MTEGTGEYKYDVAFSFLSKDLRLAKEIDNHLGGLRTFVYERKKEELLGQDGMDVFTAVFAEQARLAVILYRDGWGQTPWTAVEENAIKGRMLRTRYSNFMVVTLDESTLPTWIPPQHMYASAASEKTALEMAAVIRARARYEGAVLRQESTVELALRRSSAAKAEAARMERQNAPSAVTEVQAAATGLFQGICDLVDEIRVRDSTYQIRSGYHTNACTITGGGIGTTLTLQRSSSVVSPHQLVIALAQWRGECAIPSATQRQTGGQSHVGVSHYSPQLSLKGEWVWRLEPNADPDSSVYVFTTQEFLYSTAELADAIVKAHVERLFEHR